MGYMEVLRFFMGYQYFFLDVVSGNQTWLGNPRNPLSMKVHSWENHEKVMVFSIARSDYWRLIAS